MSLNAARVSQSQFVGRYCTVQVLYCTVLYSTAQYSAAFYITGIVLLGRVIAFKEGGIFTHLQYTFNPDLCLKDAMGYLCRMVQFSFELYVVVVQHTLLHYSILSKYF